MTLLTGGHVHAIGSRDVHLFSVRIVDRQKKKRNKTKIKKKIKKKVKNKSSRNSQDRLLGHPSRLARVRQTRVYRSLRHRERRNEQSGRRHRGRREPDGERGRPGQPVCGPRDARRRCLLRFRENTLFFQIFFYSFFFKSALPRIH